MNENKELFIVTYAHYYDFEIYTESRVYDNEEKAQERAKMYARDVYDEYADKSDVDFDDWCFYHTDMDGISYDVDGCEYYKIRVEREELNKD